MYDDPVKLFQFGFDTVARPAQQVVQDPAYSPTTCQWVVTCFTLTPAPATIYVERDQYGDRAIPVPAGVYASDYDGGAKVEPFIPAIHTTPLMTVVFADIPDLTCTGLDDLLALQGCDAIPTYYPMPPMSSVDQSASMFFMPIWFAALFIIAFRKGKLT